MSGESAHELRTGGDRGYLRIATEEAFAPPQMLDEWRRMFADGDVDDPGFASVVGYYLTNQSERTRAVAERLGDLGALRIQHMDEAGIDQQILSLTSPGTQVFPVDTAVGFATLANDQLHDACRRWPGRFAGLTAIAPHAPAHAVEEIRRGHDELGFHGVIVNSHTQGEYLDDPRFYPIFEAAESLGTPIYLHPNSPPKSMIQPLLDSGLEGAIYGFGVETGMHLLRLITAGVFDRFPKLRIVVGHLGEALPYWMFRLDYMHAGMVRTGRYDFLRALDRPISDYLTQNVWYTTSGMAWEPVIMFARQVLGADRVMYAMDYPYQYVADEVRTHDNLPLYPDELKALFQTNAEDVFGLTRTSERAGETDSAAAETGGPR